MEPFVDFGLFEMLAATGLAWLARRVYARRIVGAICLTASVVAPSALVVLCKGEMRWIAAVALAAALINGGALLPRIIGDR